MSTALKIKRSTLGLIILGLVVLAPLPVTWVNGESWGFGCDPGPRTSTSTR